MNLTQPAISVVVPTIGRPAQLRNCLESLTACTPKPSEIIVVDQSATSEVSELVEEFEDARARAIPNDERGVAAATNLGLQSARHDFVAITHDDCSVAVDWMTVASALVSRDRNAIYTGSVLPSGDSLSVPATIDDPLPRDYTGKISCRVLFPNNMVCPRSLVLSLGGFDNRMASAEDNDFCYRWLRTGHRLMYEPSLRVWHHDWRSPEELNSLYHRYGRSQGLFYAKHLRRGDLHMLRFIGEDLIEVARATLSALVRRQRQRAVARWRVIRGVPEGVRFGWREFRP